MIDGCKYTLNLRAGGFSKLLTFVPFVITFVIISTNVYDFWFLLEFFRFIIEEINRKNRKQNFHLTQFSAL